MNALMNRSSLFDDIFKDLAPAFYVRPLHGDPLPTPAQIKVDVKENMNIRNAITLFVKCINMQGIIDWVL